ncbi:hypothetical protein [Mycoplasma zalophidermidis]|uniref:EF-hand domain-containing protein n=1 Tax=Mycoplasma zalophidermidis TaxID=398174 RepID=A0ABS6DRC7_9MOLU|nr:hypothetical protein [Mycoplasma zalophidermidis]MBU4689665.1 hypothetical protein [Mycoplasma zalophidermidis]MBU4693565.1 hypothetical protein [Mycoplasma zalophidermidis]MCR8966476.1 hypothetical protein [Mycoplasma zalophidermidis]
MSSVNLKKFFVYEDKSKDTQIFTLENALTGECISFESLSDLYETLVAQSQDQDARTWIFKNKKTIGSLSKEEFKLVLDDLDKVNVPVKDSLTYIIEKDLLNKDHELVFVDPRQKRIYTLLSFAIILLIVAIVLAALTITGIFDFTNTAK